MPSHFMGFKEFLGRFSFKSAQPVQNLEREQEFIGNSNSGNSLFDKRNQYGDSLYKAYIPNFLYKPYFGYPLNINVISLKKLAKNPYVFSVTKTILDQVATASFDLVEREGIEIPEEYKEHKRQFLRWIDDPNVNEESFNTIRRMWVKDLLEIDAGVVVKVFNRLGQLRQIFVRSGGSFLKNTDIYGTLTNKKSFIMPAERQPFATQYTPTDGIIQSYATQFKETAAYFQYSYTSNALPVPYGTREIIYSMLNPNTDVIYGVAPLQILQDVLYTLIYGTKYNLDYYTNRNTPNGILQLAGIKPDEIEAVRNRMNERFKINDEYGQERVVNGQIPITDRDMNYLNFGLKPAELEIFTQQQWFSKLVWAVYAANANEMGFCYSEDTKVLTNNGLKYYWELNKEDKIATVLEDGHEIEYIKPDSIHTFNVQDRNFHHYKSNHVDVLVSDDHRMRFKTRDGDWQMKPSKDIDNELVQFIGGDLNWKGEYFDVFTIPEIEYENNKDIKREQQVTFKINDFCEFLGYYLSEGSVLKKMNEKKQYPIKISQTNLEGIEIMQPIMEKLNFRKEADCWKLNNKSLAIYLHQFGDSSSKFIPQVIKNLPKEQLRILLDALIVGDGIDYNNDKKSIRYTTSSKRLAEDVLEIMLKLGYASHIQTTEFKNHNWNTSYDVCGNVTRTTPRLLISKHREDIKYTGIMWCPSVKNRPFITERNGKLGVHYNTENSNKSTADNQTDNMKRKVLDPIFNSLAYYITTQIMNEEIMYIDSKGKKIIIPPLNEYYKFKFDDYDLETEIKKLTVAKLQLELGIKTPKMLAEEFGIDYDKVEEEREVLQERQEALRQSYNNFNNNNNNNNNQNNQNNNENNMKNVCKNIKKEDKIKEDVEKKAKRTPATATNKDKDEFSPLTDFIEQRAKQLIEVLKQDGNTTI